MKKYSSEKVWWVYTEIQWIIWASEYWTFFSFDFQYRSLGKVLLFSGCWLTSLTVRCLLIRIDLAKRFNIVSKIVAAIYRAFLFRIDSLVLIVVTVTNVYLMKMRKIPQNANESPYRLRDHSKPPPRFRDYVEKDETFDDSPNARSKRLFFFQFYYFWKICINLFYDIYYSAEMLNELSLLI